MARAATRSRRTCSGGAEDVGKRSQRCLYQLLLIEIGHCLRLRTSEPACEHGKISRMLRPPDRNARLGKQERQIGEIASPVAPPAGPEAHQDFDDVAEADLYGRRGPRALHHGKPIYFRSGSGTVRTATSHP